MKQLSFYVTSPTGLIVGGPYSDERLAQGLVEGLKNASTTSHTTYEVKFGWNYNGFIKTKDN